MSKNFDIEDYKRALRLTCKRIFEYEDRNCPFDRVGNNDPCMYDDKCSYRFEQCNCDEKNQGTEEEKIKCWEEYFLHLAYINEEEQHDTFIEETLKNITDKYML